jgi:hypothetical protein
MKVDNPTKTSSGWIHQTSARMVWPNAGLVIAVSAFGIREGFRLRGKIDMQRTQSQFQALQKFVKRSFFYSRLLFAVMFAIDAVACWNRADAILATGRLQRLVKFEPGTS